MLSILFIIGALACIGIAVYGCVLIRQSRTHGKPDTGHGRESVDIDKAGKLKFETSTGFAVLLVGVVGIAASCYGYRFHLEDELKRATEAQEKSEKDLKSEQDGRRKD